MNSFAGVFGAADPIMALNRLGVEPVWCQGDAAFGGAPVWTHASNDIVVSGEIILDNAGALATTLEMPGAEQGVLLAELYRRYGAEAATYALGMFAVAIYDRPQQRLVMMRDGVGARTLYYATDRRTWWFAARLSSLRRCPAVRKEISVSALRKYLTFGFVPGAETLWQDVLELRPGTALVLPEEKSVNYWEPVEGTWDADEPLETHATRLRALLGETVQVRLPSSGPVGIFLSGGVDSSLVTALAARDAPGPVHTYALHFGPGYPNELAYSTLVADHCGTQHHIVALSAGQVQEALAETMSALDDPIGDPLTVPNLMLGRAAAQDVGIILNGEGGDPCFGGPKNLPMLLHALYSPVESRENAYLRAYQKCYDDLPRLFTPEMHQLLTNVEPQTALITPFLTNPSMPNYLNKLMHINVRLKGADQILTKVNNLTTAAGVLGQSPLFDRRLVEASFAIPPAYKLSGTEEKAVLKHAVADLLPETILRRPKSGMMVPVQAWFKREFREYASGLLLSRRAIIRPYLDQQVIRQWLDYRGSLWPRYGVKLWLLLALEVWLQEQTP